MANAAEDSPRLRALLDRIDRAVAHTDPHALCQDVKAALREAVADAAELCPAGSLQGHPDHYARNLLYRDPQGRYIVAGLVWAAGQGTPLHDHAGVWCVECVYRGAIRVVSYEMVGEPDGDLCTLKAVDEVRAGIGEAGALIPPYEYHTLENAAGETAITIHVYGGDMTWCHAFYPVEGTGRYRRERKELAFC